MKVLVTTFPFAEKGPRPLDILKNANLEVMLNPFGRKMTTEEVADLAADVDIIVAGTELLDSRVLDRAKKLKLISRVGIGLDGIDLEDARRRGVIVSYTPDAPAPAVSELAVGLMLSSMRHISQASELMHDGGWRRFFGKRIGECTIGIIGAGRIGSRVIQHLSGFSPKKILVFDKNLEVMKRLPLHATASSLDEIFKLSDVISLHVPLTSGTRDLITLKEMKTMKQPFLVNTSRGGIINEKDLYTALKDGLIPGAAIDVFEVEPYTGPLKELANCVLTSHMGSMSDDCRVQMEIEASEEAARFARGEVLKAVVTEDEYLNQRR